MRFPIKITDNFILEPVLGTFGVKRESSWVEIGDGTLEISMGRWFHERLPLSAVSRISTSDWPWWGGLGVKLHHHGVGVVGSTDGIVNIQLDPPQKVHAVLVVDAAQLWLSLEDPNAFLSALAEARGIPVSDHTKF